MIIANTSEYNHQLGDYLELKSQFFDLGDLQHTLNKTILKQNIGETFAALSVMFPDDVISSEPTKTNSFSPADTYLYCVDLIASGYYDLPTQRNRLSELAVQIIHDFELFAPLIENDNMRLSELYFSNLIALFFNYYVKMAIDRSQKNNAALAGEILLNVDKIQEKIKLLDLPVDDSYLIIAECIDEMKTYVQFALEANRSFQLKNPIYTVN